jgi:hypothetical protein
MDIFICHNQQIDNQSAFVGTLFSLKRKVSLRKSASLSPSPKAFFINGQKSQVLNSLWLVSPSLIRALVFGAQT